MQGTYVVANGIAMPLAHYSYLSDSPATYIDFIRQLNAGI